MVTVTFLGEKNRPKTGSVSICGVKFIRGKPIQLTQEKVQALQADPSFGQFYFEIKNEDKPESSPAVTARRMSPAPRRG